LLTAKNQAEEDPKTTARQQEWTRLGNAKESYCDHCHRDNRASGAAGDDWRAHIHVTAALT